MTIEWRSEWTKPSLIAVTAFGIGFGCGFGLCSRRKSAITKYVKVTPEVELTEELDETRVVESESTITLEDGVKPIAHFLIDEQGEEIQLVSTEEEIEEVTTVSVFTEVDETWDYDEELKTRGREAPYVIHRDEYYNNEKDYGQSTLVYYAGDDILVDENDVPIYNHEKIASPLDFGKGSGDPNVVHIRNDHLEAEYEVVRDNGHYAVEILGQQMEEEFKHSDRPVLHKMRPDR